MSCSDILLSFLQDAGEDWADSFIFPEVDSNELMPSEFLTSKPLDFDSFEPAELSSSPCSTSSEAEFVASEDESDFDFDDLDMFEDVLESATSMANYAPENFAFCFDDAKAIQLSSTSCMQPLSGNKKRKASSDFDADFPRQLQGSKPNCKAIVDGKIASVVTLLKQYKGAERASIQNKKSKQSHCVNPTAAVQNYLTHILGANPVVPAELLQCTTINTSLSSKSLSSFVLQSQSKNARQRLSAWMPLKTPAFPEIHNGVGQVAAASRSFSSAMRDLISPSIIQKLVFNVHIDGSSVVAVADKLSASFVWRSEGMVAMGFQTELEFNGLIRCSLAPEGVATATVLFDACKLVRQTEMMFQPASVSSSLL
jgi:hypothetical protein